MRQRDLNEVIAGSITGRAEVMVAIAGLVEEVAHLAFHVKRIVAIVDAAEAERAAEAGRVAAACATETAEQVELKAASAARECDVQAVDMAEAANFPLSPQQDSSKGNASTGTQPKDASCREQYAIAARVAELYDRLGGFIKPSLPQPPDQNT